MLFDLVVIFNFTGVFVFVRKWDGDGFLVAHFSPEQWEEVKKSYGF